MSLALPIFDAAPARAWRRYVYADDHKIVGLQYLFFALLFFGLGGLLAMLIRWQLAWPDRPVPVVGACLSPMVDAATGRASAGPMSPEVYNVVFSMHATIMVFFVVIPMLTGAFGTYLVPLKIGARRMAFPALNGSGFWLAVVAGAVMVAGFFLAGGAASNGWTSYLPLSALPFNQRVGNVAAAAAAPAGVLAFLQSSQTTWPGVPLGIVFAAIALAGGYFSRFLPKSRHAGLDAAAAVIFSFVLAFVATRGLQVVAFDGQSCWYVSLMVLGLSNVLGAVNVITTVITLRCPGMRMFRLPLSIWSLLITALLVLLATPVLAADMLLGLLDHHRLTSFFLPAEWVVSGVPQDVAGGGYALLHPHLFWFYSHPAVYIMILPAMGMVSDILSCFARKPIFGYRPMVYAMGAIAGLGFLVWGHHMFQSGMNPYLGSIFATSSLFIAIPSAIKTFNWIATLWGGNIRLTVPLLFAAAFVSMFVVGGLSGIFLGSTALDVHLHMTYFVVAHIHYVLFGASTFGIFAALYFYYPKMFGRMMSARLGYAHFALTFVAFNCTFFAMHAVGLEGFPRRVANPYPYYQSFRHLQPLNQFISVSAFALGASQLLFAVNFVGSWIWGRQAGRNPWEATTLEWTDADSPPAADNFRETPFVYRGAYEYSSPLVEEDFLPQSRRLGGE